MNNPLTGKNAPGRRFRFCVRSIAHRNLYLPIEMRNLPQIRQLLDGISPLVVFSCDSISSARHEFYNLRKKYDFPYWAALDFQIRDMENPQNLVTLRLNRYQHQLIDCLMKDAANSIPKAFIITKSFPKCGLTACVQAFILWSQLYKDMDHSASTCSSSFQMDDLMANIARNLDKKVRHHRVFIDNTAHSAFFQDYSTPHVLDRVPSRYVHLADMTKWSDPSGEYSSHIFSNALSSWIRKPSAIFIMEGDYPSDHNFHPEEFNNPHIPEIVRLMQLERFSSNPLFLYKLALTTNPKVHTPFRHIHIDSYITSQ